MQPWHGAQKPAVRSMLPGSCTACHPDRAVGVLREQILFRKTVSGFLDILCSRGFKASRVTGAALI
jgi:hypothetical protein